MISPAPWQWGAVLFGSVLTLTLLWWIVVRPLRAMLPIESPEGLQAFWTRTAWLNRRFNSINTFVCIVPLTLLLMQPGMQQHRSYLYGVQVMCQGLIVYKVLLIAGELALLLSLDRILRGVSWSWAQALRHKVGFMFYWNTPLPALFLAPFLVSLLAPDASFDASRFVWFLMLVVAFFLFWITVRPLGHWMLNLQCGRGTSLDTMVARFSTQAGANPLRSVILPETGGRLPLALVGYGEVVVSRYLIDNMTEPEVRAIVAHELAHVAHGDLRRRLIQALLFCFGGLGLIVLFPGFLVQMQIFMGPLLLGVVACFPLMYGAKWLLLKQFRQQEFRADRLAAEWIGDPALLAEALRKLHAMASQPEHFPQPGNMTHPSQADRIEALRAMAAASPPNPVTTP